MQLREIVLTEPVRDVPCTIPQAQLWFLHESGRASCAYNVPVAFDIRGPLDVARLTHALEQVCRHHPALRSTIEAPDGVPRLVLHERAGVCLDVQPWAGDPEAPERALRELAARPFALDRALVAAALLACGPDRHILLCVVHHAVFDSWSCAVLLDDLGAAYAGLAGAEAGSFLDYAEESGSGAWNDDAARFWREALADAPRASRPPPTRPPGSSGGVPMAVRPLGPDAVAGLLGAPRRERVTPFTAFLAAVAMHVAAESGQDDLVLGVPVNVRFDPRWRRTVGFCVNTLPLRVAVHEANPVAALRAGVKAALAGVLRHARSPLAEVLNAGRVRRDAGVHPLFQVAVVGERGGANRLTLEGAVAAPIRVAPAEPRFEVAAYLELGASEAVGIMEADGRIHDARMPGATLTRLERLLAAGADGNRRTGDLQREAAGRHNGER